jgi:hypothetical protein
VKRTKDGLGKLYDNVEHVAGLFLRTDGERWLVVLRAEDYLALLKRGER